MLKHIGRHGDRKVAILFREVPGENHMCLVVYPDTLPTHIHNSILATLESPPGQASTNLADVLHRNLLPDGRAQLVALHQEGMIKKVPTSQIIVTPTANSSVKLDEMNQIIREMETGESAMQRLQELDANSGFVNPAQKRKAAAEYKRSQERGETVQPVTPLASPANGALNDQELAANMLAQAKRMEIEAKGMVSEAARMKKEAQRMFPSVQKNAEVPVPVAEKAAPKTRERKKAVTANVVQ